MQTFANKFTEMPRYINTDFKLENTGSRIDMQTHAGSSSTHVLATVRLLQFS